MPVLSTRTYTRVVVTAGVFLACAVAASSERTTNAFFGRASKNHLRNVAERLRAKHALPGLAAIVVNASGRSTAVVTGVRNVVARDNILISDRFHIASCTKSMTAMLAAVAVHRGELRWSSRMTDVLPELAGVVRPEYRTATLEQLLAHRAMMPPYTQFGPERLEQLKRLAGTATQQRLDFLREVLRAEPPNTGTDDAAYSNVGYTAAAAMLERSAGIAWERLILTRLAEPLAMSSVQFGWPATTKSPRQPRGHYIRDGRVQPQPLDDSYVLPVALWPAGAVNATVTDLGRYAADQLAGLRGEPALLPQSYYQKLHRTLDGSDSGFTLGWGIRRDSRLGVVHYGAGSGGTFFVRMLIVPDRNVALVAASNSGQAGPATRELFDELLK